MNLTGRIFSTHFSALIALFLVIFIALACDSGSDWKEALGGKKLTMAKTSGSFSDRVDIWFCSSGEYALKTDSTGLSTGGAGDLSTASQNVEIGRWEVDSDVLILQSEKGKTHKYDLSQGTDSKVIRLNGQGYLITGQNECR